MSQCYCCNKSLDDGALHYYGVVEKHSHDSAQNDAQFFTISNNYTPQAIIRLALCPACRKKYMLKLIGQVLLNICPIVLMVVFMSKLMNLFDGKTFLQLVWGICWMVFCIRFIIGIILLIHLITKRESSIIEKAVGNKIQPSCIVYPVVEEDLDVSASHGVRDTFTYLYVPEKTLQMPLKEKAKEGSKAAAYNTLRAWARRMQCMQLPD